MRRALKSLGGIGSGVHPLCVGLTNVNEVASILDKLMRDALKSLDGTVDEIEAIVTKQRQTTTTRST